MLSSKKRSGISKFPYPIDPPEQVLFLLRLLQDQSFEAYIVGGCVRDSYLGLHPNDWDITTSAMPEEVVRSLPGYRVLTTGLKHGTVTVFIDSLPVEVTTYRIDGAYSDGRHPDAVSFSRSLREDLARRDFTVNTLAYSPAAGLEDYFNGLHDLHSRTLRCVGIPEQRFQEDALRILRALRFAATLGFTIEKKTAYAIFQCKDLLRQISAERIQTEFSKLLCGRNAERVLRKYRKVIAVFIPEIRPMAGLDQHSPYHIYDVWEHTLHAVSAVEPVSELRLAMLLHDIGKPLCYSMDAKGIGHFYGHQKLGSEIAKKVLKRLRFSRQTVQNVTALVRYHDISITDDELRVKRWLNKLGEPLFRMLLQVNRADTVAHSSAASVRMEMIRREEFMLEKILSDKQCFQLKDLAVGGKDLLAIGIPEGQEIGKTLQALLEAVMEKRCFNQKEALLTYTKKIILPG